MSSLHLSKYFIDIAFLRSKGTNKSWLLAFLSSFGPFDNQLQCLKISNIMTCQLFCPKWCRDRLSTIMVITDQHVGAIMLTIDQLLWCKLSICTHDVHCACITAGGQGFAITLVFLLHSIIISVHNGRAMITTVNNSKESKKVLPYFVFLLSIILVISDQEQ